MISKISNIILTIASICILCYDFIITKEFSTELIFFILFVLILTGHGIRLIYDFYPKKKIIASTLNIVLLAFLCYSISILALLVFGATFSGRQSPIILNSAIIVALLFIPIHTYHTFKLLFHRNTIS